MRNSLQRKALARKGAMAILIAILLILLIGFVTLAIDVGYVALTKTSLQAAADAACLSGGTELMRGLGRTPDSTNSVTTAARTQAKAYAAKHANGDVSSTYIDSATDVRFGWAIFNNTSGAWDLNWNSELPGVGGYNLIGVTAHRDRDTSNNGDGPLPLIFARVLGNDFSKLQVDAAAVIMPAKGVRITPGSDESAEVMPFVLSRRLWEKYLRAQNYYELRRAQGLSMPAAIEDVPDPLSVSDPVEPLFGHWEPVQGGGPDEFIQDFADLWSCGGCSSSDGSASVAAGENVDGVLEIDIFPRDGYTAGNFGTIDIGPDGNSSSDLARQIRVGVNASDLAVFPNNMLVIPNLDPGLNGDTGISAGIKDDLESILGVCRAVLLFDTLASPGNNAQFGISQMAGIRIMDVELTGQLEYKHLSIQVCDASLTGAVGDLDDQIGEGTTVYTPLILVD